MTHKIHTRNFDRKNMLSKVNTRRATLDTPDFIFTRDKTTGKVTFTGYAVKWSSVNSYGEQFKKGAFAALVSAVNAGTKKVHMYYNHGWRDYFSSTNQMRIGKWTEIAEDETGLKVTGELTPNLPIAQAVSCMLEHGTIDGLSIAFYNQTSIKNNGVTEINNADVYEISVVDEPSDNDARIAPLSESINKVANERDAELLLERLGVSANDVQALATRLNNLAQPTHRIEPSSISHLQSLLQDN